MLTGSNPILRNLISLFEINRFLQLICRGYPVVLYLFLPTEQQRPTCFELVEYTRKTCHLVPLFDQVLLFRYLYCAMVCNKREIAVQASVLWISSLGTKIGNTIDFHRGESCKSWFEQPALGSTYIFIHMYVLRTMVATATRALIFIYLLLPVF